MKEKLYDIYRHNGEGENSDRYVLGRSGERPLLALCLNPSTATDEKRDATMTRLERFAEINGFNGFVMINLYPQRSTRPSNLDKERDLERHKENLAEIARIVEELKCDTILAAWGNNIGKPKYLSDCLKDIAEIISKHSLEWKCIALTSWGQPQHPSRAAYGRFQPLKIEKYL